MISQTICKKCAREFKFKVKKNADRQFCSNSCSTSYRNSTKSKKPKLVENCKKCLKNFETKWENQKFCSRSCANSYTNSLRERSEETNRKTAESVSKWREENPEKALLSLKNIGKGKNILYPYPRTRLFGYRTCNCCSKKYWSTTFDSKTCSPECARLNSTYRKIVHLYEHNGIQLKLESSWEVEIASWLDGLNVKWERPKHIPWTDITGKNRKYFPDFYLNDFDIYVDPKNLYLIGKDEEKLQVIGKMVTLVYGNVLYIKQEILKIMDSREGFEPSELCLQSARSLPIPQPGNM